MSDPEYRGEDEEKERLALKGKETSGACYKEEKIVLAELKEQAEKAIRKPSELEERRAIARERSRKSAEKLQEESRK